MVTGDRVVSDLAAPGVQHRNAQGMEDGISAERGPAKISFGQLKLREIVINDESCIQWTPRASA